MLLWGTSAYLAALVPRDLARDLGRRLGPFRLWTGVAAIASTAFVLPIEVADIGNGWADAADPSTVTAVLFDTSVGHAWQVQAVAALLLAATVAVSARLRLSLQAGAAGLLLASVSLNGHARMHEGWLGIVHPLIDAVHVLAGGAWLGALVPLLMILQTLGSPAWRRDAGTALRRFSTAGHLAVALVVATGAANTALVLGRWPTDLSSPYQVLLDTKIAIVAVMVVVAVANRYWLVPQVPRDPVRTVRALRFATAAEIGLGFTVVALVSVFGLFEPA